MIPSIDNALRTLMMTLMSEVSPAVSPDYLKSSVNLIGVIQLFAAEEFDRAADNVAWENQRLATLLRACLPLLGNKELAERCRTAAEERCESFRVSELTQRNHVLKKLFIEVHAATEQQSDPASRSFTAQCWDFLSEASRRRSFAF